MLKTSSSPCQALTKKGKPCRAAATEGGLCFFHANPNKAVELGRIGGKTRGRILVGTEPLPNLDNAIAVRDAVARLIADIYAGKLHPRIAAGLAPPDAPPTSGARKNGFRETPRRGGSAGEGADYKTSEVSTFLFGFGQPEPIISDRAVCQW